MPHEMTRIRRDARRRLLTVASIEPRGDVLLRIWFFGEAMADFASDAPDDHVKLFLPDGKGGVAARDYTPRGFDEAAQTLAIEFALHGDDGNIGPATRWAMEAKPGDVLEIGGPRGSTIVADDFDWYLLIGDETALPAIGRRLEEMRPDATVSVLVSIARGSMPPDLPGGPYVTIRWLDRGTSADAGPDLLAAIAGLPLPSGDGFVWIAAEAKAARDVRSYVIEQLGHPVAWVRASGYWVAGEAGGHTRIGE